jgi:hypothetical protein
MGRSGRENFALVALCAFVGLLCLTGSKKQEESLAAFTSKAPRQASIDDSDGDYNNFNDPMCYHPHGGVPRIHDLDANFAEMHSEMLQGYKKAFDGYKMPDLVTIENSFYFRTLHPKEITGKNFPALSRAWNDSFVVVDHPVFPNGPIWGNEMKVEEARKKWSIHSSGEGPGSYLQKVTVLPPGEYATFSGWYVGNFGHFLHDHASKIAWIKHHMPNEEAKFILPHHPIHESILQAVDPKFVKDRVIWVSYDETVYVPERGSLTVMIPKDKKVLGAYPQTGSEFTESFRQWLEESHWSKRQHHKSGKSKKVIWYTRQGGTSRRLIHPSLESELIDLIRSKMNQYGRNSDDLVIFNGKDSNGETLSIQEQFDIFSEADTAIGPHGSGLANVIWMDPRCKAGVKVLEFASSERTKHVQNGSIWGYWLLYGTLPWIDYHYIYYTERSHDNPARGLYIDIQAFEEALDEMLGGPPMSDVEDEESEKHDSLVDNMWVQ